MSSYLIAIIGFVYLAVAVDLFLKGQIGLSISFVGYSLGNLGLWMVTK